MPISGHHSTREPSWEQGSCVETSESFLFPQDRKWRHFHAFSASLMGKQESSWNGLSLSNSCVERNYNLLPESSTYRALQEEALKSVASDLLRTVLFNLCLQGNARWGGSNLLGFADFQEFPVVGGEFLQDRLSLLATVCLLGLLLQVPRKQPRLIPGQILVHGLSHSCC